MFHSEVQVWKWGVIVVFGWGSCVSRAFHVFVDRLNRGFFHFFLLFYTSSHFKAHYSLMFGGSQSLVMKAVIVYNVYFLHSMTWRESCLIGIDTTSYFYFREKNSLKPKFYTDISLFKLLKSVENLLGYSNRY